MARGPSFSIEMQPGVEKIQMGFEKWADLIDDFGPVFNDIARMFRKHERDQFRSQGKRTGPAWHELSKPYEAWKNQHFPGRPILVLTGALRGALVKGGRGSIGGRGGRRTSRSLELGVDPGSAIGKYAEAHQFGTGPAYKKQKEPRPPVRFDASVHSTDIKKAGKGRGAVPLGTAIAQMFQAYIVRARKMAKADVVFDDQLHFSKMRRGVLSLKTR